MGLFAGKPAGIQIKRWLIILVFLIVLIDVLAAGCLIVLRNSINTVQERYQPALISAGDISTQVFRTQASLYKYLGEYVENTEEVLSQISTLETTIDEASRQEGDGRWQEELGAIRSKLDTYRMVVKNLPQIGGVTDWEQVNEFRTEAMSLGRLMESEASRLKADASAKIAVQAEKALGLSRTAFRIFLFFLILSLLITGLLLVWWQKFQDMILNL